jgi:hypothetical protein
MVRPAYRTRLIEPFEPRPLVATSLLGEPLSVSAGTLVVVGQGLESLVRQDVWRRLAHGEWGCAVPFAQVAVGAGDFDLARASVPRSRHGSVFLSQDVDWLVEETGVTDVVAWCPGSCRAWSGLATEDAWDEVCAAIRRLVDARG